MSSEGSLAKNREEEGGDRTETKEERRQRRREKKERKEQKRAKKEERRLHKEPKAQVRGGSSGVVGSEPQSHPAGAVISSSVPVSSGDVNVLLAPEATAKSRAVNHRQERTTRSRAETENNKEDKKKKAAKKETSTEAAKKEKKNKTKTEPPEGEGRTKGKDDRALKQLPLKAVENELLSAAYCPPRAQEQQKQPMGEDDVRGVPSALLPTLLPPSCILINGDVVDLSSVPPVGTPATADTTGNAPKRFRLFPEKLFGSFVFLQFLSSTTTSDGDGSIAAPPRVLLPSGTDGGGITVEEAAHYRTVRFVGSHLSVAGRFEPCSILSDGQARPPSSS